MIKTLEESFDHWKEEMRLEEEDPTRNVEKGDKAILEAVEEIKRLRSIADTAGAS